MVALYVYGFQLIDSSYGVRAYFNLLIDTISLIAIFEYVKNKNIFKKIIWKTYLPILLSWHILSLVYDIYTLSTENADMKVIWAIVIIHTITIVLYIPTYIIVYYKLMLR